MSVFDLPDRVFERGVSRAAAPSAAPAADRCIALGNRVAHALERGLQIRLSRLRRAAQFALDEDAVISEVSRAHRRAPSGRRSRRRRHLDARKPLSNK